MINYVSRVRSASWLCAVVASASLSAQTTWIVDQSGSGNFPFIPSAILAASPGDTIVIRGGGSFAPVRVDRSLHFAVEGPRPMLASFETITPGIEVTLTGVDVGGLIIDNARATLEDVRFTGGTFTGASGIMVRCTKTSPGAVTMTGCTFALDSCSLEGSDAWTVYTRTCVIYPGSPALRLVASTVDVAGGVLQGGDGNYCSTSFGTWFDPGYPAITMDAGSRVRVTGTSMAGGQLFTGGPVASIESLATASDVIVDPGVSGWISTNGFTRSPVPGMTCVGAPPGGTMTCQLQTEPLRPAAIAVSLGMRPPVPTLYGETWVDLSAYTVLFLGGTNSLGMAASQVQVPMGFPAGVQLVAQGIVQLTARPVLTASTPSVMHIL